MAKEKLFKDPDALLAGYNLKNPKKVYGRRKVYLTGRKLNSGNVALVRYAFVNGKIQRISTGVTLAPETSLSVHLGNEEKVRLQRIICDNENSELERIGSGFKPVHKRKDNMLTFLDDVIEDYKVRKANSVQYLNYKSLRVHIDLCFDNPQKITFNQINVEFATKFCQYLSTAENQNYLKAKDVTRRKRVQLTDNGKVKLWAYFRILLNKAVAEDYLIENPCAKVKKTLLAKPKISKREYLEVDELRRLINTPFPPTTSKGDIRDAFLFGCFSGLRFSDLCTVALKDIYEDQNGKFVEMEMKKTGEDVKVYLPEIAFTFIPKRKRTLSEPLFNLPRNVNCNMNVAFKKWFINAGITKYITFHCTRHTFATILLSNGEDIATVSKLLGHSDIKVTQIYADIVSEKKAQARILETYFHNTQFTQRNILARRVSVKHRYPFCIYFKTW